MTYWQDYRRCFRGPYAWTSWVVLFYLILFLGTLVWSLRSLLSAGTTRGQILGATFFLASLLLIQVCKLWLAALMHRLAIEDRLEILGQSLKPGDPAARQTSSQ